MRRSCLTFGLCALAAALAVLHARPAAQDVAVPFKVGEVLTYDVSWMTTVTAGTATLSVKDRRPIASGATAYDLVAEGRPTDFLDKLYHLYYKAESLLNSRTLRPTVATIYSDERGRQKLRTLTFTGPTTIEFTPRADEPREKRTVPPASQDPLSAMYVIRAVPLKTGQVVTMPVVDGSEVFQVRWQVGAPEPVTTPAGSFSAFRITPAVSNAQGKGLTNRRITLWLSNDARRLPLKLEAGLPVGTFTLTLTRFSG